MTNLTDGSPPPPAVQPGILAASLLLLPLPALLALLFSVASPAEAQTSRADPTDLQAWYSAELVVELPRGWEVDAQYRLRMVDDASTYRGSYLYGNGEYEVASWLAVMGGYRLGLLDDATTHRYTLGAQASHRMGDLRLGARALVQHRTRVVEEDDEYATDARTLVRTRLRARHPLSSSVDLVLSTEPFFTLEGDDRLDNMRNQVQLRWEYARRKRMDLFYIHRPNFRRNYDRTFHIVGVGFSFEIRPFR